MVIINQDRDGYVVYDYTQVLFMLPIIYGGIPIGIGVFLDSDLLGVFYNLREALWEIRQILIHPYPVYQVTRPR